MANINKLVSIYRCPHCDHPQEPVTMYSFDPAVRSYFAFDFCPKCKTIWTLKGDAATGNVWVADVRVGQADEREG